MDGGNYGIFYRNPYQIEKKIPKNGGRGFKPLNTHLVITFRGG